MARPAVSAPRASRQRTPRTPAGSTVQRGPLSSRGFTLIEVMLVVVITGCLAAMAVPNFIRFQCRAKQSEARQFLQALATAEHAYQSEYGNYPDVATLIQARAIDPKYYASQRYYSGYSYDLGAGPVFAVIDTRDKLNPSTPGLWSDLWTWDLLNDREAIHGMDACQP